MFSPLDQILTDEDFPELNNLLMKLSELSDLQQVANKKGILMYCMSIFSFFFFINFLLF
jgi:hypothetical protein